MTLSPFAEPPRAGAPPAEELAVQAARRALSLGDAAGALAGLDAALAADPAPSATLRLVHGLAAVALGRAADARADLLAAAGGGAELAPRDWWELVPALMSVGDPELDGPVVDAALQAAVEHNPDAPELFMARGHLYRARGQLENAINEYDYAAELNEHLPEAWLALAECELAQDRPLDAADALDHAADLDPNEIDLFARLGDALLAAGDPARAIRAYEEGLELDADAVALYHGRARAAMAMQLYQDAAEDAQAAVTRAPDDAEAWLMLGQAKVGWPASR
jgi:tetratricopeptide (TPR) repeat protein